MAIGSSLYPPDPNTDPAGPQPISSGRDSFIQTISSIISRAKTEDRGPCPTCKGEGWILKGTMMHHCPQCRADSVDYYGQRGRDGNLLTWKSFAKIAPDQGFLAHRNRNSFILVAPPQKGKTLFLRTLYNDMLDRHRFRRYVLLTSEFQIIESLKSDEYRNFMSMIERCKAILIDNFASPDNWSMWPEIRAKYFDVIDTLYEKHDVNFYAVGCHDYRSVIKDEKWLWRLKELARNQIVTVSARERKNESV